MSQTCTETLGTTAARIPYACLIIFLFATTNDCRVDFNVPIEYGIIGNDYRIRMTLPTIKLILEKGASPILMSHLGRPRGVLYGSDLMKGQEKWSLLPVAKRLEYFLKCEDGDSAKPVLFAPDCMNAEKLKTKI